MPKIDDDSVAGDDVSVAGPTPEEFDFASWLEGAAPATAQYKVDDRLTFHLEARTADWREALEKEHDGNTESEGFNLAFIAGHIVAPKVTVDDLRRFRKTHGPELNELAGVLVALDVRPRSQIQPRFLPDASD